MATHLVRWDEKYGDRGLVILDIDNGEIDSRDKLERHVKDDGLTYPVAWDEGGKTCRTYGVRGYPSCYVLNRRGEVVFEGVPAMVPPKQLEALLERLLREDAS